MSHIVENVNWVESYFLLNCWFSGWMFGRTVGWDDHTLIGRQAVTLLMLFAGTPIFIWMMLDDQYRTWSPRISKWFHKTKWVQEIYFPIALKMGKYNKYALGPPQPGGWNPGVYFRNLKRWYNGPSTKEWEKRQILMVFRHYDQDFDKLEVNG